jgi:4-amino-4-deoxy-L-arabinose transferase-like glycosyltransferase
MDSVTNSANQPEKPSAIRQLLNVSEGKFWLAFTVSVAIIITIAAIFWILAHPYATNWDEARYINQSYRDAAAFYQDGIAGLKILVQEDRPRPPAFRILVLPFSLLFGPNPTVFRLVSWLSWWGTLGLVYLAAKRIAGVSAGAFAALFLALCPIIIQPSMRFYVDYPLYVAVAAMLYFLFVNRGDSEQKPFAWIGLGLALGLGGMAKPTILFIAAPVMLLDFGLRWLNPTKRSTIWSLFKAVGIAIVVMLPWWGFNAKPAIAKAFLSGGYARHALGEKGALSTILSWLYVFAQSMLGPALTLLAIGIVTSFVIQLFRKQLKANSLKLQAVLLSLAGALPLLFVAMVGTNHNPRLTAIALVPLAIGLGIMASLSRWLASRWLAAATIAIFCFQLVITISPSPAEPRYQAGDAASKQLLWGNPTTVMQRREQWDWSKLKELCDQHGISEPAIAYMGNGGNLTPEHIRHPWIKAGRNAQILTLWLYVKGPIDWNQIEQDVYGSDVVLTGFDLPASPIDKQDLDNVNNAELVKRLEASPDFSGPYELQVGRFTTSTIVVFLNNARHNVQ